MTSEKSELVRAGLGLAIGLVIAGLISLTVAYGQGVYDRGYEVRAIFPTSSQGLFTDGGSTVKLRGVNVGTVAGIDLLPDGSASIRLLISEGVRLPVGTTASIEPLSIFGPKFVRLESVATDSSSRFLVAGDLIERGTSQRELSDILATATELFEAVDPVDVIAAIDAVAEGTVGLGPNLGRTIDASADLAAIGARNADQLGRFLRDFTALAGTLAEHADDLLAINRDVGTLVGLVNQDPGRIDRLLDTTTGISTAFSALLADNAASLDSTVEALATFLSVVDRESTEVPELIDLVGTFFGRLSDVIRFDAPAEKKMAGLRGFISLDLCLVFGVCPSGAAAAAAASPSTAATEAERSVQMVQAWNAAQRPTGPIADVVAGLLGGPVGQR